MDGTGLDLRAPASGELRGDLHGDLPHRGLVAAQHRRVAADEVSPQNVELPMASGSMCARIGVST